MVTVTPSLSADGTRVAEVELVPGRVGDLDEILARARAHEARLLWAYAVDDLTEHGFARTPGFVRLEGEADFSAVPDDGEQVVTLGDEDDVRLLRRACFVGRFGHKTPAATHEVCRPAYVHLGLVVGERVVGTCRVEPAERYVDAPGVLPEDRTPRRYVRLLRAAVALMGPGQVVLEGWGEPAEILACYERAGLRVVAHVPGWQRRP